MGYYQLKATTYQTNKDIAEAYEWNTGVVILERFSKDDIDPNQIAGVLVANHAPFTWGKTIKAASQNSTVLEEVARMNTISRQLNANAESISEELLDKHFFRKHGKCAYYGQTNTEGEDR